MNSELNPGLTEKVMTPIDMVKRDSFGYILAMSDERARKARWKASGWVVALSFFFILPYHTNILGGFIISSFSIAVLLVQRFRTQALSVSGLKVTWAQVGVAAMVFFALSFVFPVFIDRLVAPEGYNYAFRLHWRGIIDRVGQVLNEEVVLRSLLMTALIAIFPRRQLVAFAAALIFALLHVALYGLGEAGLWLKPLAVVNLAIFGWAANWLYLRWGHVLLSFAVHLAWNFNRFNGRFNHFNGIRAREAFTFNLIEARPEVTALIAGIFCTIMIAETVLIRVTVRSGNEKS